jgi:hypothetical protein
VGPTKDGPPAKEGMQDSLSQEHYFPQQKWARNPYMVIKDEVRLGQPILTKLE